MEIGRHDTPQEKTIMQPPPTLPSCAKTKERVWSYYAKNTGHDEETIKAKNVIIPFV